MKEAELIDALRQSAEALETLWAAIGDALCSGKGISKVYAQNVASDVKAAADRARAICGWPRVEVEYVPEVKL